MEAVTPQFPSPFSLVFSPQFQCPSSGLSSSRLSHSPHHPEVIVVPHHIVLTVSCFINSDSLFSQSVISVN